MRSFSISFISSALDFTWTNCSKSPMRVVARLSVMLARRLSAPKRQESAIRTIEKMTQYPGGDECVHEHPHDAVPDCVQDALWPGPPSSQ
ncbi:hypothetical protein OJ252_3430 [Cryptosporidium canis]|uniref:Uncharacterized protein n=1 Tax=Cryptosporidium canis TaxID=195482 RepID=A0ABQ8P2C5_9CRYT|nr:hypothetical protein OJ252_3430 [Cryptosporidium canis]